MEVTTLVDQSGQLTNPRWELKWSPKKAASWWHKSLATAERLGSLYEGSLTELEIGLRLGDRTALEKAAAAFEAMGAAHDLQRALVATGALPPDAEQRRSRASE